MGKVRTVLCAAWVMGIASWAIAQDDLSITLTADGDGLSPLPVFMLSASGLMVDWTNPDGTAEFRSVGDGALAAWAVMFMSGDAELEVSVERGSRPVLAVGMFWQSEQVPQVSVCFWWPASFEATTGFGLVSVLGYLP